MPDRAFVAIVGLCIVALLAIFVLIGPRDAASCGAYPCEPTYCDDETPCPEECLCRDFRCVRMTE